MSWFDKILPPKINSNSPNPDKKAVPQGVWNNCDNCQAVLYGVELERSMMVCPKCGHHMRIDAKTRILRFLDEKEIVWLGEEVLAKDILKFKDSKRYKDRLAEAKRKTGSSEALLAASGSLHDIPVTVAAFDFNFMGGSMGSVVGERFVRAANHSLEHHQPFICFSASGGARMQEALFSLMQMSKTSAVINKLKEARIPYVSVLTDPTMGGVSASLAMLGDVIIAEPNALVGFAGPTVIQQTVRETLPEGFQRAEFLLEHGAIDMLIDRRELRNEIASFIDKLGFIATPVQQSEVEETA